MEFVKQNCQKFSDVEENKLEYTNIYTEYLHFMETAIESQLKTENGF
jgi:hypothetical protein